MRELKIDTEFRDLLPALTDSSKLEALILQEGYDGTPILVWNGYIVDGHNRYKIFKKHDIDFNIEEISIDKNADKSEIMNWIKTYQSVRRNMSDAESIYVEKKISEARIKEENEKRKIEGNSVGGKGGIKEVSVHLDGELKSHTKPTHTREQIAKSANVSLN